MTKKEFINSIKPKGAYSKTDFTKYVELSAGKIRVALLNKNPEYLLPIFNLIEDKDSSVGCELEKRVLSTLNKEYTCTLDEKYISSIYDITKASLECKLFGIAVLELYLDENQNFAYRHISREYFNYREDKVYLKSGKKEFVAKSPRFIILRKKPVLIKLIWIVYAKHFVLSHYLKFTEFLGVPPLIGHSHSSDKEVIELMDEALKNLKSGAYGIFGSEDMIKILEGRGTQEDFLKFIEYADNEIAKVINGQTLTSNSGKSGSYALGKIHENTRREIINSDIKDVNFYVNYCFNFIGMSAGFKIPLLKNSADLGRVQTFQILTNMGYEVDEEQMSNELNVKLKHNPTQLQKNSKTIYMDSFERSIHQKNFNESKDIEEMITNLLNSSESYDEAYDKAIDLFGEENIQKIEIALSNSITNSSLKGFYDN